MPTIATKNSGIQELLKKSVNYEHGDKSHFRLDYGPTVSEEAADIVQVLVETGTVAIESANLVAIKLLEGDQYFINSVKLDAHSELKKRVKAGRQRIQNEIGYEPEIYLAGKRYEFIVHLIQECVQKDNSKTDELTEKIDRIVTNKWLGIPLFFSIMFLLYQITMAFGNDFLGGYVEAGFGYLGDHLSAAMVNSPELMRSFVIDAMIGGVGSVLVFVPLMLTMYFMISDRKSVV